MMLRSQSHCRSTLLAFALLTLVPISGRAEDTSACFDAIYALQQRELVQAVNLFTRCIETGQLGTSNLIVAHNDRGNAHGRLGNYDAALHDFNRVIELAPDDPDAWYNRGLTLRRLGRTGEALNDYDRVLELDPGYTKAYINRGSLFGEIGQLKAAVADFTRAIDADPSNATSWFNRALGWYSLGNYTRAVEDLEKAIDLNPDYLSAYEHLAWLRATCPDRSIRDGTMALALARKARFLLPDGTPRIYDIFAAAYASQGSFDEAIRYQQLAIEASDRPEMTQAFMNRLELYRTNSRFESAPRNRFLTPG